MIDIRGLRESVSNRESWAARGASFVAKVKATKAVWFPPNPTETGKNAVSTTRKATTKAATKAAKKPTKATKKATSAVKKT